LPNRTTGVETEEDPFKCASFDRMRLMTAHGSFSFAIELQPSGDAASGETIGFIGLFRPPACGYLLDEPYWGKGYATESLKAFVRKYWEYFPEGAPNLKPEDRNILLAGVFAGNRASENVLKKAGFREVRKDVAELPSGVTVQETVFMIERPEKVPVPVDAVGLPA
jgi:RimJ/RimL family protein N-acetyltransferase